MANLVSDHHEAQALKSLTDAAAIGIHLSHGKRITPRPGVSHLKGNGGTFGASAIAQARGIGPDTNCRLQGWIAFVRDGVLGGRKGRQDRKGKDERYHGADSITSQGSNA